MVCTLYGRLIRHDVEPLSSQHRSITVCEIDPNVGSYASRVTAIVVDRDLLSKSSINGLQIRLIPAAHTRIKLIDCICNICRGSQNFLAKRD